MDIVSFPIETRFGPATAKVLGPGHLAVQWPRGFRVNGVEFSSLNAVTHPKPGQPDRFIADADPQRLDWQKPTSYTAKESIKSELIRLAEIHITPQRVADAELYHAECAARHLLKKVAEKTRELSEAQAELVAAEEQLLLAKARQASFHPGGVEALATFTFPGGLY